jgi:pimeloyl-ACP methyl ester carboxylesterase
MGRRPFASVAVLVVVLVVVIVMALAAAACSGSGPVVVLRNEQTGTISWKPCAKIECGTLSVPLDFRTPQGKQITLALARLPARRKAIGVLFSNPGGPGGSGVDFLREADDVFPAEIRDSFDIVSWDPRGVGASAPVVCQSDLDPFYAVDHAPQTAAGVAQNVAASRAFVAACKKNSAALLPYVSTVATARDMDAIRAAIGAPKISYVGFSYGTLLGALYADMYPTHVRAMVLDGAVDPARSYAASTVDQAKSFDADLNAFFTHCRTDTKCSFAHGDDPATAYRDLARTIEEEPVPGTVAGEHRTLGPGEFDLGVASALYSGADGYDDLASALAEAARGVGDQMLALTDAYTGRTTGGKYSNETEGLYAIGCIDSPAPTTVAAVQQLAASAARVAPYFGASTVWLGLPCTFWPVPVEGEVAPIHAPAAPPIVVVGTIRDPATPYAWAVSLASELKSGRLLTAAGASHTSYGRGNACVDGTVDRYLLTLRVPAPGTRCA